MGGFLRRFSRVDYASVGAVLVACLIHTLVVRLRPSEPHATPPPDDWGARVAAAYPNDAGTWSGFDPLQPFGRAWDEELSAAMEDCLEDDLGLACKRRGEALGLVPGSDIQVVSSRFYYCDMHLAAASVTTAGPMAHPRATAFLEQLLGASGREDFEAIRWRSAGIEVSNFRTAPHERVSKIMAWNLAVARSRCPSFAMPERLLVEW